MATSDENFRGVVHGKVIQLETDAGLPDGQKVSVTLRAVETTSTQPGDGIRRSAGGWSDDPAGLDAYLEESRRARQLDRPGIDS